MGTSCLHFGRQLFLTGGGIFVHSSVVVMQLYCENVAITSKIHR